MQRLDAAWQEVPLVWLAGVRRVGKTVLARGLGDSEFLNCDLPSESQRLEDPETFFKSVRKPLLFLGQGIKIHGQTINHHLMVTIILMKGQMRWRLSHHGFGTITVTGFP